MLVSYSTLASCESKNHRGVSWAALERKRTASSIASEVAGIAGEVAAQLAPHL